MASRRTRTAGTDRLGTPSITKNSLRVTLAAPWALWALALMSPVRMLSADRDPWAPAGFLFAILTSLLVAAWAGHRQARMIRPDLFGE